MPPLISELDSARTKEDREMANTYTAVIKQDEGWWIGWVEEVPGVNCQERTREALLNSLRTTLAEAQPRGCHPFGRTRLHGRTGHGMKRTEPLKHLREHGGVFIREGGSHSWWGNPAQNRRSSSSS